MEVPSPSNDVIKGYRFCATLQLRTPLAILRMHGQEISAQSEIQPVAELWHGIWLPVVKTWKELTGVDIEEFQPTTMASEVGQVPVDGGELLEMLIRIREVVEEDAPLSARRERLQWLLQVLPQQRFIGLLGGKESILNRFFPPFLSSNLRWQAVDALEALGRTTPRAVSSLSDDELLGVPSIGPKTLLRLRAACAAAGDPDCAYVDGGLI